MKLQIDGDRLWGTLMEMGQVGRDGDGVNRLALNDANKEGRDLFTGWLRDEGLEKDEVQLCEDKLDSEDSEHTDSEDQELRHERLESEDSEHIDSDDQEEMQLRLDKLEGEDLLS